MAKRNDFTPAERREWQRQMLLKSTRADERAAGERMPVLNKAIDDALKPAKQRQDLRTIVAPQDSSCFADLRWKAGIATATFWRGGAVTYEYEMSRSEFNDWIGAPDCDNSLGEEFNDWIR